MRNMNYKVTENNGGGIALYCVDAEGNEFAFNGYEYNESQLFDDLFALLDEKDVTGWENNQLTDEDNCRRFRTTYDDKGNEVIDEDEIFDENEDLIPLDVDEYFDDHETTKLVLEGDENEMTIHRSEAGHNFSKCLKNLVKLIELEDRCPKITIE